MTRTHLSDDERMLQQARQRIWTQTVMMPGQNPHTFWHSVQQDLIRALAYIKLATTVRQS